MDKSNPFYERICALINYGFELKEGTTVKNKSGSLMLQVAPYRETFAAVGNMSLWIDEIPVGHYSASSKSFVYNGGSALRQMYPESKIKRALTNLLRQHLNRDQEEYGHRPFPIVEKWCSYRHGDIMQYVTALVSLGIFEVPVTTWDLGFYTVRVNRVNRRILISVASTDETVVVVGENDFSVHSNKFSQEIFSGMLYYLVDALSKWWQASGKIAEEPPLWDWVDMLAGVRVINLDWLAWNTLGPHKSSVQNVNHTISVVGQLMANGANKVAGLVAKEYGDKSTDYATSVLDHSIRTFVVYKVIKQLVY